MGNRYEVNRGLREAHADPSIRVPRIQLLQSSRYHYQEKRNKNQYEANHALIREAHSQDTYIVNNRMT